MYLVCEDNPKFEESGKLIKAAHEMGLKVKRNPDRCFLPHEFPRLPCFIYGTRDFVLPIVNVPSHIFSKQEYLYDYSFLLSTASFLGVKLFNDPVFSEIIPASRYNPAWGDRFVRPNSGNKQFAGQVVNWESLCVSGLKPEDYLQVAPWELLVVSKPKKPPVVEHRFFVIRSKDDEKIDLVGCQYLPFPTDFLVPAAKAFAIEEAQFIFDKIPFGDSFVMDIALDEEGRYSVIELNSWNSSSFYSIDPKKLLEMVVEYERS